MGKVLANVPNGPYSMSTSSCVQDRHAWALGSFVLERPLRHLDATLMSSLIFPELVEIAHEESIFVETIPSTTRRVLQIVKWLCHYKGERQPSIVDNYVNIL